MLSRIIHDVIAQVKWHKLSKHEEKVVGKIFWWIVINVSIKINTCVTRAEKRKIRYSACGKFVARVLYIYRPTKFYFDKIIFIFAVYKLYWYF